MVGQSFVNEEAELRRKIAAGSGDLDDYRKLAELQFTAGLCEEAITLYEKALDLPLTNCQRSKVSLELGWLFYEIGRQAQARGLAQNALGLLTKEPESAEVLSCRGSSQSLLAHCLWFTDAEAGAEAAQLALKWLDQAVARDPEFDGITTVYYEAARLHNLLGNAEKAITLCEMCLQQELDEATRLSCLIVLADALQLGGQFTRAEKTLEEAFRYAEADREKMPLLYFTLALMQRSTNREAVACENFEKALEALQTNPYLRNDSHFLSQIHWNLGELYYNSEDYNKALESFRTILDYDPEDNSDHRNALLWLGHCYFETGAHPKARECYEKVLASPNGSNEEVAGAREGLAKVYYTLGQYREAEVTYEGVLGHYPQDSDHRSNLLLWLGNCYEGLDATAKAQDCFEKVLASPHASEADKALAGVGLERSFAKDYYDSEEYGKAAAAYEKLLDYYTEDHSYRPYVLLSLGHCYLALEKHAKARDCYEQVLYSQDASESDKGSAQKGLARLPKKTYH